MVRKPSVVAYSPNIVVSKPSDVAYSPNIVVRKPSVVAYSPNIVVSKPSVVADFFAEKLRYVRIEALKMVECFGSFEIYDRTGDIHFNSEPFYMKLET